MKHSQLLKCLAILFASAFTWETQAQNMEQVTGELKEKDIVIFKEVKLGYVMSNGNQANLIEYSPDGINIQFVVEGNATDGYQFLVENTSNSIVGDHAPGEMYLCGGTTAWDVFIRPYDAKNCTWFIVPDTEPGIYKIKNKLETRKYFVGVNYRDAAAGYPLWRDKLEFSYPDLENTDDYGIFWQIFRYGTFDYYDLKLNQLCKQAEESKYNDFHAPMADAYDIARVAREAQELRDDPNLTEQQLIDKISELSAWLLEGDSGVIALDSLDMLITNNYDQLMERPYPDNAKEALTAAYDKGISLFSDQEARRKDFENMIVEFNAAIRTYLLSGLETATEGNPINSTWMLTNPDFETGNLTGWKTNGFVMKSTAGNYSNMQGTYFVETYTNPINTLGDFYIEQTVSENLPNGKYRVVAHIVACNQNADSTELVDGSGIRGVDLYINSASLPVGTENGQEVDDYGNTKGGRSFTFDAMVTNNKLKTGIETLFTNANWVGIDNFQLSYLGAGSLVDYQDAYNKQLDKARKLLEFDILPKNYTLLNNALQTAETAEHSTIETICPVINALNIAIDSTRTAIKEMKNFKAGSYKGLPEQDFSTEDLEVKIAAALSGCDAILKNDTTTAAAFAGLEKDLAAYITFVKEFNQTYDYTTQTELYSEEALKTFTKSLDDVITLLNGFNANQLAKASHDLWFALAILRSSVSEIGDMTRVWLINPSFDDGGSASLAASGWVNEGNFGANTAQVTTDANFDGVYCMEKWVGYGSVLADMSLSQTINGLPNGRYTITLNAKAMQQVDIDSRRENVKGVYLFANSESTEISTPLIVDKENCELDPETGDTLVYAYLNSINSPANTEAAAQTFSVSVEVKDHLLTVGFATKNTTANWVAFDKFALICNEIYGFVGIEEINDTNLTYSVYSENGYIKVTGTDDFKVTTLSGISVPASTQLAPGIYIVKVGNQTTKVAVK